MPLNSDSFVDRNKLLIIGDSILKNVDPRGLLSTVDVVSMSGAKVNDVSIRLHATDLSCYKKVILYIGGNDLSGGKPLVTLMDELKHLKSYLMQQGCIVHMSTVAPRKDVDVFQLNKAIEGLSRQFSVHLHKSFVFGDGLVAEQYYYRDGIHLNRKGTSLLVRRINAYVTIIKTQPLGTSPGNNQNRRFQPSPVYPRRPSVNHNMRRLHRYRNHYANGPAWPGDGSIQRNPRYLNNMQTSGNGRYNRQSGYTIPTQERRTGSSMNTGNGRKIYNDNYTGSDSYFHGNKSPEYRIFCEFCNMNTHSTEECGRRY